MDFPLYRSERYRGGNKAVELAEFMRQGTHVLAAQRALALKDPGHVRRRVFHAKTQGCLAGRLELRMTRPGDPNGRTFEGLFKGDVERSYPVLARFSNGVGRIDHDLKPDVRGLALKIFGVRDPETGEERVVDFLMTNSPSPVGRDQAEFVQFMEAQVDPGFLGHRLAGFLITHPRVALNLVRHTLRVVPSLAAERFWSGHAYLLGPNQAMKFNVAPATGAGAWPPELKAEQEKLEREMRREGWIARARRWARGAAGSVVSKVNADYLSRDLRRRAAQGEIRYVFAVQLEKDAKSTPVEDALTEWKEKASPSIPVADLVFDRQRITDADDAECEKLAFTPGHFIPAHRPLGNMGRGRIFTYQASQLGRRAATQEPDAAWVEKLRRRVP